MTEVKKEVYYGYCRESVDLKSGIAIQHTAITDYAKRHDIHLEKVVEENNASAMKQRPKFDKLIRDYEKYDGILVNSLDRFGRSLVDILQQVEFLKSKGKHLICLREGVDTRNKASEFFLKIMAVCAEYDRVLVVERMNAGRMLAEIKGSKSGKPCHRPRIDIDWPNFAVWKSKGLSIASIAKIMGYSASNLYKKLRCRESPAPHQQMPIIHDETPGSQERHRENT